MCLMFFFRRRESFSLPFHLSSSPDLEDQWKRVISRTWKLIVSSLRSCYSKNPRFQDGWKLFGNAKQPQSSNARPQQLLPAVGFQDKTSKTGQVLAVQLQNQLDGTASANGEFFGFRSPFYRTSPG